MSTGTTEQKSNKPRLAELQGELAAVLAEIGRASAAYSDAKKLLAEAEPNPAILAPREFSLLIDIGGTSAAVPLEQSDAEKLQTLQDAVAGIGSQVIGYWRQAHEITTAAVRHCDDAVSNAQQQQG